MSQFSDMSNWIFGDLFDDPKAVDEDQWTDVVTAGPFEERTIVSQALYRSKRYGPGASFDGHPDYLKDGTLLHVPENTAAYIFAQGGIEQVLTAPGGYVYDEGLAHPYDSELGEWRTGARLAGNGPYERRIAFVNLRELRNIDFETSGPIVYNDSYYDADLEIEASGSFSVRVCDTERLVREFVPAGVLRYSFDFPRAREQVVDEFLQSFAVALDTLSGTYRISQLPAHTNDIARAVESDEQNVGSWPIRFGFALCKVAIEKLSFSQGSRTLVENFNAQKMARKATHNVNPLNPEERARQLYETLRIFKGMLDEGMISMEEYEAEKRKLLNQ